jgi:hypothetical protein
LLVGAPIEANSDILADFSLESALSRVPTADWDSIAYTDLATTMQAQGGDWPTPQLSAAQQSAWEGVWLPRLFSLAVEALGFSPWSVERVVEARQADGFALWLEGQFELDTIITALLAAQYEPLSRFPSEAYRANPGSLWQTEAPYIALLNGHTLLIASSQGYLADSLAVYDGLSLPIASNDVLLPWMSEVSPQLASAVIRFDQTSANCPAEASRMILHGLRYVASAQAWEYILNLGYPSETIVTNVQALAENLEFSAFPSLRYGGVIGQHTTLASRNLYESGTGSLLQFILSLAPQMQHLPFELAQERDSCRLFAAPPANANALALKFLPDLSGGQVDYTIRFGNAEQSLYDAGVAAPLSMRGLNAQQELALSSTWRTDLASQANFAQWFGFEATQIRQAVELAVPTGDYARLIWGDFDRARVEKALTETGYVALEQHKGVRLFTLRDQPEQGGFLLSSLAQTIALPADGVMLLSSQVVNLRLTLDIYNGDFRSPLIRAGDFLSMARALHDATTVTLKRYWNPLVGGLVCGLPPYRSQGFANVQRSDGWHFLYALGFTSDLAEADLLGQALAASLESSEYPLFGPGSQTFGDLSQVWEVRVIRESGATVLVVDLAIDPEYGGGSFFGQDLSQASLAPCALGDISQ